MHIKHSPSTSAQVLTGLRVLLVDDDPDCRELFQFVLEQRGATVVTAGTSQDALSELARDPVDVLVSDIGLPDEDGLALLRKVRRLEARHGGAIPAVAITAFHMPEDRDAALDAGFQLHAAKPVDTIYLIAIVAALAGRLGAIDLLAAESLGALGSNTELRQQLERLKPQRDPSYLEPGQS